MKKLFVLLFSVLLITVGCNNGDNAGTSEDPPAETADNQKDTKEANNAKKEEAKLEIADSTGGAWKDSIDNVWVHSAAVYKNTGTKPVDIGETQMNFKGQDGGILGTATMIYSVPAIVKPGETAFIGETTMLDGITDAAQYKETTYNFGFDETEEDPNLLEVSGVNGIKGDEYTPYKVTGVVKNTTEEKQDDIRLAAGLFDANGKLLGVLTGSVDVGVNPGSEAGFELTYPEIPREVVDQIANVEVKSYGWAF